MNVGITIIASMHVLFPNHSIVCSKPKTRLAFPTANWNHIKEIFYCLCPLTTGPDNITNDSPGFSFTWLNMGTLQLEQNLSILGSKRRDCDLRGVPGDSWEATGELFWLLAAILIKVSKKSLKIRTTPLSRSNFNYQQVNLKNNLTLFLTFQRLSFCC